MRLWPTWFPHYLFYLSEWCCKCPFIQTKRLCVSECPKAGDTALKCHPNENLACGANSNPDFEVQIYDTEEQISKNYLNQTVSVIFVSPPTQCSTRRSMRCQDLRLNIISLQSMTLFGCLCGSVLFLVLLWFCSYSSSPDLWFTGCSSLAHSPSLLLELLSLCN